MKVWVVKTSEMLASDSASGRLLRSGLIAHMLDAQGHAVTWWMSTFDHAGRRHRCAHDQDEAFGARGAIRMIHSPGYRASISLARLRDHFLWGRRFAGAINSVEPPDIIFCAYPTIEAASVCMRYGRERGVPVVIDLRDMWPDIFLERVPAALLPVARVLLQPLTRQARSALHGATALFGITEEFVDWGLRIAGRPRAVWDCAFPLGYPRLEPAGRASDEQMEASAFWDRRGVQPDEAFNVVLVGTITRRRFELDTVLAAARELQHDGRPVRFIIAGDGDDLPLYRARARDCSNVLFPGWLRRRQITELLARAHLGLVPYRNTSDLVISIPNKVAEYLAAGLPIATCLQGTLSRLLRERQCGVEFSASRPESLVAVVRSLRDNTPLRERLAANARDTFQERFVAETVYGRLIQQLESIAAARGASSRPSKPAATIPSDNARRMDRADEHARTALTP